MNGNAQTSRKALQRLIILVLFALVIGIFSYGWTVTDIDLTVPQQPQRQLSLGRAIRELFSPDILDQDYVFEETSTSFLITCSTGESPAPTTPPTDGTPYITI